MTDQERVEFAIQTYRHQAKRDAFCLTVGAWAGCIAMWWACC